MVQDDESILCSPCTSLSMYKSFNLSNLIPHAFDVPNEQQHEQVSLASLGACCGVPI